MAAPFFTELQRAESGLARAGRLDFGGGVIVETPAFMPVGTAGTIKGVWLEDVRAIGYRLILGNTYHLYLRRLSGLQSGRSREVSIRGRGI
jgi:queuine tRNA-ribosyltransferase